MPHNVRLPRVLALASISALCLVAVFATACGSQPASGSAVGSKAVAAIVPPPPMLTSPRTAVYSYLVWVSYAYRILNSEVATQTFTPDEEVRVNSYVELNKEAGKALEQTPTALNIKSVRTAGNTSTVVASEKWQYRYINTKTGAYSTPQYTISYDTTYTVVFDPKSRLWRVGSVDALPLGKVK